MQCYTIDMSLDESIRTLLSYSLVKRSFKVDSFSIHPLVHSWARLYLDSRAERETEIARRAFEILQWAIYVPGERATNDWIFEQRVMLHIDAVATHMDRFLEVGNVGAQDEALTISFGNVYTKHGRYDKALRYYKRALAGKEKCLGVDHPDTLATVNDMALVFQAQGQYDKALKYHERAFLGRPTRLGGNHPATQCTHEALVKLYEKTGQPLATWICPPLQRLS